MVGKPENFDKLDTRYRMTLIQMEKRFVDLETTISDISARVKDINFDAVAAVQQRVDDIEDLIMVEQAAVFELKKMMEAAAAKSKAEVTTENIKAIEDKLAKIETDVKSVVEKPTVAAGLEERVNKLQQDVSGLKVRPPAPEIPVAELEKFEGRLNAISNELMVFKKDLKNKIDVLDSRVKDFGALEGKPTADYDFFSSKIDSLKAGIDLLTDKKFEADLKISGLEEKINIIEKKARESLSQKVFDGIRINKKDIMATSVRVEAIEKVLRELTEELHELMKTTKKFENFERLAILNKDIEEKLERFKFIEDENRRLSQRMEMIYDDLDKRLETIKSAERDIEKIEKNVSELGKELGKQKVELHQKVGRESLLETEKKTDNLADEVNDKIVEFENRIRVINKSQMGELSKSMDSITKSLNAMNERVGIIEETYKNLDVGSNIGVRIKELEDRLKTSVETVYPNMRNINKKLENDYARFNEINKRLENLEKTKVLPSKVELPETFQRALVELKASNARIYDISKRISIIEDRIKGMQSNVDKKIAELKMPTDMDTQIAELIDKIVFLESRLGAMEGIVQKTQNAVAETKQAIQKSQQSMKAQPVILE